MSHFRVGVDNYGLYPLQLDPMQTMQWAKRHGAEGVHFSGLDPSFQEGIDAALLRDLAAFAREGGMYLEWGGAQHIPRDAGSGHAKELLAANRRVAEQAAILGTRIIRSCSGGLMRWRPDSPMTETLLQETATALLAQRQMLLDHHVILAIETHFEFTSFELVRLFERCEAYPGEWLGVCLDTMNLLTMLEDPVNASRRLLPWIVATHIKDGGVALAAEGFTTFPAPAGSGVIDFPAILRLLKSLAFAVTLSVEGHGGSFQVPVHAPDFLSKFPDLTAVELAHLIKLAQLTAERSDMRCRIVERDRWPDVCESRLAQDIIAMKEIAAAV